VNTVFFIHLEENNIHNTSSMLWEMMPCSMAKAYRLFGGAYCLQTGKQQTERIHEKSVLNCY
jgi:hypothetical protein